LVTLGVDGRERRHVPTVVRRGDQSGARYLGRVRVG
jgi:hypothetical protein